MKTYWIYLEPYTFLFQKDGSALLYNTFSGKSITIEVNPDIKPIIDAWNNLYCAEISEAQLKNKKIASLTRKIRNSFSGDIVEVRTGYNSPVILQPILNFQKNNERLGAEGFSIGDNVLKNLSSLVLYLNGACNRNCQYCGKYFKQITCCTKNNNNALSPKKIEPILSFLVSSNLTQLHVLGGDLLSIPNIFDFVSLFNNLSAKKIYHSNLLNVNLKMIDIVQNGTLKILCVFPIKRNYFEEVLKIISSSNISVQWVFIITSKKEYFEAEHISRSLGGKNVTIKPVFTENNSLFFENYIYLHQDDINNIKLNKRQIFANQCINVNEFGTITIFSDGHVYGNINFPPLGKIDTDLRGLIYSELETGTSWFRIRNQAPCNKCVYQWLCPPPSNYEIAIGRPNLCHVKK
jgi:pseudo-rSAM protein